MANRRMLHKTIFYFRQVNELSSDFGRLLFTWAIPYLDDFGRIDGDPKVLKAMVMPMSEEPIEVFENAIQEIRKEEALRFPL